MREWRDTRTVSRMGSRIKPAAAYAGYSGWCAEEGKQPVSLTAFGNTMKGELGVKYEEKPGSKRGFYVGIALLSSPRLAVSNT